jgi:L,D-peptidoglycan transpeptidase YkuD (ErfK/YbiS/YcfS/YnhG family)
MSLFFNLLVLFLLFSSNSIRCLAAAIDERSPLAHSRQALLVLTDTWESEKGEAQLFERDELEDLWKSKGPKMVVNVGKNGLGWGSGLHGLPGRREPVKREGDKKSPAGVFKLSSAFGYAAVDGGSFFNLPYIPIDAMTECVDDVDSRYYNQILQRETVANVDWNRSEKMLRKDGLYKWGAVVEHNPVPRLKKGGSCIFLHIWEGPSAPTSGCTSFSEGDLLAVLKLLRSAANPVLIQLPQLEYLRLREVWKLP